jgi:LemA protein
MEMMNYFLAAAMAAAIIWIVAVFNSVIRRKNMVENAFASIDAMTKRRYDLIPNLVDCVTEYMSYEMGLMERLTQWRTEAVKLSPGSPEKQSLDGRIGEGIRSLFAVAEGYPSLRTSDNFLQLQGALNEVEDQIAAARRAFNAAVTDYNNGLQTFPWSVAAGILGYQEKKWFEVTDENERKAVSVRDQFRTAEGK